MDPRALIANIGHLEEIRVQSTLSHSVLEERLVRAGFKAFIVERDEALGGLMKRIHHELMGEEKDIQKKLKKLVRP